MDKENKMVSIIVPVYNTAKYLIKCLNSILEQTYKEIEVILVDDGSSDGSELICDEYEKKDSRVHVIHKKNEGIVATRKEGLRNSKGEFICPVDSDDYISKDMLENMMNIAEASTSDIVQCAIVYESEDGSKSYYEEPLPEGLYDLTSENCKVYDYLFWNYESNNRGIRSNLASCIFRRSVIEDIQMEVPNAILNGEDDACYYPTILKSQKYYFADRYYYFHLIHNESTGRNNHKFDLIQAGLIDQLISPYLRDHVGIEKMTPRYQQYIFCLSNNIIKKRHGTYISECYKIDLSGIPQGSRVVVFGVGEVGQSYVNSIITSKSHCLVAIVDSTYKGFIHGISIDSPEVIREMDYDYVLVAVRTQRVADNIRKQLVELGVNNEKIIWNKCDKDLYACYLYQSFQNC